MLSIVAVVASQTQLAPTVLKCRADDGQPVSDLTVDLTKRELRWGLASIYDIVQINDVYITAYLRRSNNVGGEVWVLDRRSGDYRRGSVAICLRKATSPRPRSSRHPPTQVGVFAPSCDGTSPAHRSDTISGGPRSRVHRRPTPLGEGLRPAYSFGSGIRPVLVASPRT
jgi:hypothetical protein